MLHQVLAVREEHDALLLIPRQLELLLDDGEDLTDLEGVGHQEPKPDDFRPMSLNLKRV